MNNLKNTVHTFIIVAIVMQAISLLNLIVIALNPSMFAAIYGYHEEMRYALPATIIGIMVVPNVVNLIVYCGLLLAMNSANERAYKVQGIAFLVLGIVVQVLMVIYNLVENIIIGRSYGAYALSKMAMISSVSNIFNTIPSAVAIGFFFAACGMLMILGKRAMNDQQNTAHYTEL